MITELISKKVNLPVWQVKNVQKLLDESATIPFIARYRKEATGNLDEVALIKIKDAAEYFSTVKKRKSAILKKLESEHKLSSEIRLKLEESWDLTEIEDIYLPYKSNKSTKASAAIKQGLEPLAKIIMAQNTDDLNRVASKYVAGEVKNVEDALQGAGYIAAQWISERAGIRKWLRNYYLQYAHIVAKKKKSAEDEEQKFKDYYDFSEAAKKIKAHRLLAVKRGEEQNVLSLSLKIDKKHVVSKITDRIIKPEGRCDEVIENIVQDAYNRLLKPTIEKEVWNTVKAKADEEAINIFSSNLEQLLLQPPAGELVTLAIDPGFRSGCKVVVLDNQGNLLHNETIFPHPPQKQSTMAMKKISTMVEQFKVEAIAIGNGTASRETERFIKAIRFDRKLKVFVVNEAGASIYSASKIARAEFPNHDVTVRGAVSIGRRLMDPLAELVKLDPKNIGVGQYQHDVNQKLLKEKLDQVVLFCVNKVGINLNTASQHLLQYVSGVGATLAENIVKYRAQHGAFSKLEGLLNVPKFGEKAYQQAAGFLRIRNGMYILDNTGVHPEHYSFAHKMLTELDVELGGAEMEFTEVQRQKASQLANENVGALTIQDILTELEKPGLDPRKKSTFLEFDKNLRSIDNLTIGGVYPGLVNNLTNFGAFVNIGIKENGLIHISAMSDSFISDPTEILSIQDRVEVEVLSVDKDRKRIGLKLVSKK